MEKDLMEVLGFHPNEGAGFLHQMLLCTPSLEQRDGLFLGVLTILEVSLNWTVLSFLGSIPACPDLMTFVAGRSGAGKCIMNWVRQLAETSCQTPNPPMRPRAGAAQTKSEAVSDFVWFFYCAAPLFAVRG